MPSKRLCIDTSGLTQPFRTYRQNIFPRLWDDVFEILASGEVAMTQEIFDEITAGRGDALTSHVGTCRQHLVLDVADAQMGGYTLRCRSGPAASLPARRFRSSAMLPAVFLASFCT
ncbi:MAG: hypothetical protein FD144_1176 [Rhodospirillaceae bacterium]|nr:MAG: hypothetical protein FD144_1176 [Rhodospirillaceae bacterium]